MATEKLKKSLTLKDVYAISTGAMFSSGFFLLPGIAAAATGTSVILAYLLAGILIIPAMLSIAELSTALPRAGGAYYFLDRAMGPLVGTIGGIGSWLALVLKSAFALIGMGAYLTIYWEVPVEPLAVTCAILFTVVNIVGAKESSGLQRWFVYTLVGVLIFFTIDGVYTALSDGSVRTIADYEFATQGVDGVFAVVGMVFVSYAGLTNVASVSEEVANPDVNIPLGMFLSLATASLIYVLGVAVMVAVLEPSQFYSDLTPVATAAREFFDIVPGGTGVGVALVVIAAIAAFASTGHAGIMASSRYPMAMARDRILPDRLSHVGRFGTPTLSVLATGGVVILLIVTLDIAVVAKLASAFQLLLFGMICAAVIVMREARIDYYRPGFKSPLYPWMQIAGLIIPVWLIIEMGWTAILFILGVIVFCVVWYYAYAAKRAERDGAIFHVFERLGRRVYRGLDHEFRTIVDEKGLSQDDPFEEVVARAHVLDIDGQRSFETVLRLALGEASTTAPEGLDIDFYTERLSEEFRLGILPVAEGAAVPHLRIDDVEQSQMVMIRVREGIHTPVDEQSHGVLYAMILIVSPLELDGQHFRILARVAGRIDDSDFVPEWLVDKTEADFKETLLRDDRYLQLHIESDGLTDELVGRTPSTAGLPAGSLIAMIRRGGETIVPGGSTEIHDGDWLTVIGTPESITEIWKKYVEEGLIEGEAAKRFVG